ncbi:MAG: hypothetical protein ISR62_03855 [Desulfobacteraceae bacterium]|nr:hypothetical protein [Desulfobacterales bacterium]MBL6967538.1 hypothetical protein [Desulfobacteraceae bacterium]
MNNDKICPACGGDNIEKIEKEQIIRESFGGQKTVLLNEYSCKTCGSTGDFFNENEVSIQDCLSVLKSDAIVNILEDFSQNKISLASMERALELPQRTLTKWKNKASKPSSSGIALFKFLRIFPWLLQVAENKYDYTLAQKIHIKTASQEMLKHMYFDEKTAVSDGLYSDHTVATYFSPDSENVLTCGSYATANFNIVEVPREIGRIATRGALANTADSGVVPAPEGHELRDAA